MKVGIPRALTYYAYFPLWERFLKELGCQVLISDRTSKSILDAGVQYTVNDACIPIKVFHGHVYNLKNRVDFIFIPRLLNLTGQKIVTYCPKFLGLADMVNASMEGIPPLLDFQIDMRQKFRDRYKEFVRMGKILGLSPFKIAKAFYKAKKYFTAFKKNISYRSSPEKALSILAEDLEVNPYGLAENPIRLAVVGYPYLLYDCFLNANLVKKLVNMGIKVYTPEMVPEKELKRYARNLPKDLFWTFSNQVVLSSLYYMDKKKLDGIIHVTAFGCGPDSMVDKLVELEAKERKVPFICVSVDEHTGEAGILTRLEAFIDMLKYRRDKI